nr:MAG TPA: hypothetical protein [Caudoviricetes sp.]
MLTRSTVKDSLAVAGCKKARRCRAGSSACL